MGDPFSLWVYLSTTPLLWLTLTIGIWLVADWLSQRSGRHPLVNPVMLSIAGVAGILALTRTPYRTFFDGAQFVHFLLGPATVALGVPLFRNWPVVRRTFLPMAAALVAGAITAVASTLAMAMAFGLPRPMLVALAPKSITAGIAMGLTEQLGGEPALTAVLVIATGIIGAVTVTPLMNLMGVRDYAARGFAVGLSSHGIGTARAFSVDPIAGTFAGIAMGLNALFSSIIVPLAVRWIA